MRQLNQLGANDGCVCKSCCGLPLTSERGRRRLSLLSASLTLLLPGARHIRSQLPQVWNNNDNSEKNQEENAEGTSGDGRGPEILGADFLPLCGR